MARGEDGTGADRRTVILKAAARVIARQGVRGLRVSELAAEAGVSTALAYYHFKDRAGILRRTLEFISDRAERYTDGHTGAGRPGADPRKERERSLLLAGVPGPARGAREQHRMGRTAPHRGLRPGAQGSTGRGAIGLDP